MFNDYHFDSVGLSNIVTFKIITYASTGHTWILAVDIPLNLHIAIHGLYYKLIFVPIHLCCVFVKDRIINGLSSYPLMELPTDKS